MSARPRLRPARAETWYSYRPPVECCCHLHLTAKLAARAKSTPCNSRSHAADAHRAPLAIIARLRPIWRIHAHALPMGARVDDGRHGNANGARPNDAQDEHLR